MSTSCSPASRNWAAVAGLPLIQARLLPCESTVRRSSRLSPDCEPGFFQPGLQPGGKFEFGADFGPRRALSHHAGVGSCAQRQLQGVDQDGLARAGLAGQHGETRAELQFQLAHDHEIAQCDAPQAHDPPSFQCSFLRSVS